jgi:hypothetical protein
MTFFGFCFTILLEMVDCHVAEGEAGDAHFDSQYLRGENNNFRRGTFSVNFSVL